MSESFEVVDKPEIIRSKKSRWDEVIKAADENVGKAIAVKVEAGKKPASVMAGIKGYLKKHDLSSGYVVVSKDGKVYVFTKDTSDQ